MIIAVDTSVLLDVFAAQPRYLASSQAALRRCLREGTLVVCDVVLAELRPRFATDAHLDGALQMLGVEYRPSPVAGARLAGEAWQQYRRAGVRPIRVIADFMIAGPRRHGRGTAADTGPGLLSCLVQGSGGAGARVAPRPPLARCSCAANREI